MATSTDHKWDKIPVNKGTVDKQIVELEEFSVAINDEIEYSDDVRRALYLEWRDSGTTNGRTLTLGIYARWLIAARLLLQKSGPDTDLSKLLDKNNATVRQLFSEVSENRRIRDANRYNPKAYRPKGDKLADVLEAIIAKLNDYFGENHGREKITVDKFFSVLVAISTLSSVVGHGPVQSFEHWLETGKRQAVPDPATIPRRSESGYTVSSQLQHIVATIVNPPRESAAHKIIVNATCEQGASSLINFAADLNDALLGQRSAIWINLASGASRRDVLKSLYNQCQIDFSPAAFDARPIDLALDLKPIRDYLTGEPVVVAFMNWDNVGGTFVALHDYLCNTHWGELIRILAQPVYEKLLLLGSPVDPKYRIVVLSSQKVSDIEPWVSWRGNIDIDDNLPNKALDSKLTALQPDKVQWYRQNGEYLGEPDAGKIFLINEIPTSTLEVLGQEWRKLASLKPQQKQVKLALMKKWLANSRQTHYDLCFLKFAAVSINGMRRSTMYRCVKQLGIVGGDEFRIRTKDDIMAIMGNFLDRFRGLIEEVDDEDVEGLPTHCRAVDLDEPPRSTPFIGENDVLKKSIRFRTREWCSLFTQAWHGPKPNWHGSDPKTTSELKNGGSWPLINFVLAEECMRQATAQMHHLEAGAMDNAYTTRRLVQAIFHGLMSVACTVTVNFPEKFIKYGLTALSLPTEPGKRFRYLYTFLYRHCVEEDQWRLGRAFGRSDVRLDLLTMFVARDKGALMITGVNEATEIRLLPQPYCVEHPALPLSDAIIRCDLLEALGRAGLDQGGAHGRRTTEWALSTLPGWRLQPAFGKNDETSLATELFEINALLPARDKEYYHYADSALRLRLDYLQSSGQPEKLVDAQNLCEGQLARIGFDKRFLKSLRD
ncbi:MAG: hypothetical protein RL748_2994, partial [Pseudomonadota bacterium]